MYPCPFIALPSGLLVPGQTLPSGLILPSPTITGTVTASQVNGIPIVLAQWGVPVILASSGTMGNNGAVSAMTALPATYSGGAWLYIPAGAIAAGEPATAAFRWFVGSSTTAGTFYNSSWDGSGVPVAGTATPYVTTGPGAFTGIAVGEIVAATVTVPAGALGLNGSLLVDCTPNVNTAAGNKIPRVRFSGNAGTVLLGPTLTTSTPGIGRVVITNANSAALQRGTSMLQVGGTTIVGASGPVYPTADTSAATTLVFSLEKATATNHAIWEGATVQLVYKA